ADGLIADDGVFRAEHANGLDDGGGVQGTRGQRGGAALSDMRHTGLVDAQRVGQFLERLWQVVAWLSQRDDLASLWNEHAGFVRVSEESHRHARSDQDKLLGVFQRLQGEVHVERNPVDDDTTRASFNAAIGLLRHQAGPRLGSNTRSEEHTSELQSRENLVCRLLLEKKKQEEY